MLSIDPVALLDQGDQVIMKIIYTDVLVVGAGLAGLRMAVAAKHRGHDSIIL